MMSRAAANSCNDGSAGSGRAGLSRFNVSKLAANNAATSEARSMRGASASMAKVHHRSLEYSTWRWAKKPSQVTAPSTPRMPTIHTGVNRSSMSAARR